MSEHIHLPPNSVYMRLGGDIAEIITFESKGAMDEFMTARKESATRRKPIIVHFATKDADGVFAVRCKPLKVGALPSREQWAPVRSQVTCPDCLKILAHESRVHFATTANGHVLCKVVLAKDIREPESVTYDSAKVTCQDCLAVFAKAGAALSATTVVYSPKDDYEKAATAGMSAFAKVAHLVAIKARHRRGWIAGERPVLFMAADLIVEATEVLESMSGRHSDVNLIGDKNLIEELADVLGVVYHFAAVLRVSQQQLEAALLEKLEQRFITDEIKKG